MSLFKNKDFTISDNGISAIETLAIGGVKQSILIQTENPQNPILLFIHGGPSMPVPGVSCRGSDYVLVTNTKELVKHFTVIFWDQRGTGKSYSKGVPKETMHLKQFISDANEVTDYLRNRFNQDKLYLAAHSWGTVIALPLAYQYPEKFYSYTAFSQIASWVENDKLCYKWLLEKAKETNNQRALKELVGVGEPPYLESFKQWSVLRKWLLKYNSMFYDAGDKKSATFFMVLKIMLKSPDYSLKDIFNSLIMGFKLAYTEKMLDDLNTFDYFTEVPKIDVPIMFIHGSKEKHVMPELLRRYYEQLDAPRGKKLFWSDKSSHAFHPSDAKENEQILINHLLE
jgi:pimeloyl-ACP methyl ester carboxylesterase